MCTLYHSPLCFIFSVVCKWSIFSPESSQHYVQCGENYWRKYSRGLLLIHICIWWDSGPRLNRILTNSDLYVNRFISKPCSTTVYLLGIDLYLNSRATCSSVVEQSLVVWWGHQIDPSWWTLFLVPVSDPCCDMYVLSCLWDSAYKRTYAVNRKE